MIQTFAFSRRSLFSCLAAMLLAGGPSFAAPARDPVAILTAIYRRAVKGDGPNWSEQAERVKDLSKSLIALWARTDPKLMPGELGPVDIDIIGATNGLTLAGFSIKAEKQDDKTATVAVTLAYRESGQRPNPTVIRYGFVREDGQWKIDEFRGGGWSLREMLMRFLAD
jgi:hypothetical protein